MADDVARPTSDDDREGWRAYWAALGMPWRTEPEIDPECASVLKSRTTIHAVIEEGIYPFKGMKLTRADIEWLLATLDNGLGPVQWEVVAQRKRAGLDLRGADLSGVDFRELPMARSQLAIYQDLSLGEIQAASVKFQDDEQVAIHMENVHLEGAILVRADLRGAILTHAHLEGADLREAHLERADLSHAHLQGAVLSSARLENAKLVRAYLERTEMQNAQLAGANLTLASMDSGTRLDDVSFTLPEHGTVRLADVRWGSVNLTVVDWQQVTVLGDERVAKLVTRRGATEQPPVQVASYQMAVRANRQLAVVLRAQGMNEEADHFAYRAQILRSQSMWLRLHGNGKGLPRLRLRDKLRLASAYGFSVFLNALAGYGYSPGLAVWWYLVSIGFFSSLYLAVGAVHGPHLTVAASLVFSVTSFHGRGFFPGGIRLDDPMVEIAAIEAIWGLLIELSFIATFTQRFFAR